MQQWWWCQREGVVAQEELESFLGRLLTDDQLRHRAVSSLEEAAEKGGYRLSSAELQAIKLDDLVRIETVAVQLDQTIRRFGG
jgi:hypothetical protein